jgi:predicted RNA-binding protein with PIN domain
MKGTEYFASLYMSVVIIDGYNVKGNSEELIGTTQNTTQ